MGAWRRWVAWLNRSERGDALAAFRIAVGLTVIINVAWTVAAGVVPLAWFDAAYGGYRPLGMGGGWLLDLAGGARPELIWSLVIFTLGASVFLTLGLGARAAAIVAGQGMLALSAANPHTRGSYDALLSSSLWLLVFADSAATWSLAQRLRTGSWTSDRRVKSWPRYLAVFQLVVMYTATGAHKMSADWTPGGDFSALYYILQMPNWHRFDMRWIAWIFPVTQVATLLTWLWELSAPVLVLDEWLRSRPGRWGRVGSAIRAARPRLVYAATGVVLHTGILLFMEVGVFTLAAWALYPCLWSGDELHAARARLSAFGKRRG